VTPAPGFRAMPPAANSDTFGHALTERAAPAANAPSGEPAAEASVGDKALSGSVWLIGATGTAKALGFACQLALAWFLTKRDYGVYAIAISLSVFLSALRDGGLQFVLEQRRNQFDRFAGPVFWMMLAINTATGLLIALVAYPAARLYQIPELGGVITLFAISIPLTTLPSVLTVRLAVDLKFRQLGLIQVFSAITRNALLLLFAWLGFGARSFLLPLLVTSVTDTFMLWMATRYPVWSMPPRFRLWRELFAAGRWVLLGTFAIGFGNNGAYFIMGKFLPSELIGTYFFAFQIVVQLGVLLSDNIYQVLVASFARLNGDLPRIRAAVPRALGMVVLIGAVASTSIAAIYAPLERELWHGKWSAATVAVYILAVGWPAAAGMSVLRALQMATGHFRQWGVVTLVGSAVSVTGTVVGASLGGSATTAAIGFSVGALIGAALNAAMALPRIGVRAMDAVGATFRPWLIVVVAAAASRWMGATVGDGWADLLVTGVCFVALAYGALKLLANDSFLLMEHSMRRILRGQRSILT
jgi:O-antigen/teichoic acid export membrane protein